MKFNSKSTAEKNTAKKEKRFNPNMVMILNGFGKNKNRSHIIT